MDDLPFQAEYAKTGRASCKTCKGQIQKDQLKLAIKVQSPFHDGKDLHFSHFDCFFNRFHPKNVTEITNFASLKYEDQKKIEKKIENPSASSSSETGKGKSKKRKSSDNKGQFNDFKVEYAKSGKSKCKLCEEFIPKGDVRISKLDYTSETAVRFGPHDRWFHIDCFVTSRQELEFYGSASDIPNFNDLEDDNKKLLKKKIPKMAEPNGKTDGDTKEKAENGETKAKKAKIENEGEAALKKQSDLLYGYIKKFKEMPSKDVKEFIEFNGLYCSHDTQRRYELLADCMAFGVARCPQCKSTLVFRENGYVCKGMATEWAKCQYKTDKPNRKGLKIPNELAEEYSFLKKYKFKKRDRVYNSKYQQAMAVVKTDKKIEEQVLNKRLSGYKFVIVSGGDNYTTAQLKKKIEKFGGKVVPTVDKTVLCVITKKSELDKKKNEKIKKAQELEIHVVSDEFLDAIENAAEPFQALNLNIISSWGGEFEERYYKLNVKEKFTSAKSRPSKSKFVSGPSIQKVVVKGGCEVDPDSGKEDEAHVLKQREDVYSCTLNLVDIERDKNSYYKMQVLESDKKSNKFWLFRSWGRIGTTIGGTKLEDFKSKQNAIEAFEEMYLERTGNEWADRKDFVKHPNRYYPVECDYGQEEIYNKMKPDNDSSLAKPIQDLICMIFDVEKMKDAMLEYKLDLEKMPLGKLSKKQILNAYTVLKELSDLIEKKQNDHTKFLDATNRFFSLVPHNFGVQKVPLIDNQEMIKAKLDMLESLLELEMAYEILQTTDDQSKSQVDQCYEKLNTKLEILDKTSNEFSFIEKYVKNTHGSTHQFKLEIMEVFKVERNGENERYKKFKEMDNRMLLWHGSRATNYAGILSQGLRIAPPEAPVTGYMFGKGIYFADMVSKSANYCYYHLNDNIGLLLLSEVAIGNPWELTQAKEVTKAKLPVGKNSVKGVGKTEPDPNDIYITEDGVKVPYGKETKSKAKKSSLLYNEYIVYDVDQVNIKYLLMVKFEHSF